MSRLLLSSKLVVLLMCFGLQACQWLGYSDMPLEQTVTLESLQPAVINLPPQAPVALNVSDVIEHYTQLLPLLNDPEKQLIVLHRLADLKLQKGEQLMAEQARDELDVAVTAYTGLLTQYPDRAENDKILYQLAKTYDLKGEAERYYETLTRLVTDYPESEYLSEVQFRRGELLFAWSDYLQAEAAFTSVITLADPTYLTNARYMLGWSLFKQNRYQESLVAFTSVLDSVFSEQAGQEVNSLEAVPSHQRTLVNDLLRVMNLAFGYLDGAQSVAGLFAEVGSKHYEVLVYRHYSDWLLKNEEYSNAVTVYKMFIQEHPLNLWAPRFHIQVIETLTKAKFMATLYDEKAGFISRYGLGTDFWNFHQSNPPLSPSMTVSDHLAFTRENLERLLIELADHHYVKAQLAESKTPSKSALLSTQAREQYALAAVYNRQFVATFPEHSATAKRLFLLAESEFKIQNWLAAIEAYQQAGYDYPDFTEAAEAAYASILAYTEFSQTWNSLSPEQRKHWEQQQQANRLRFVDHHPQDKRALDVLFVALSEQYREKQFELALANAQRLIDWPMSFENAPSATAVQLAESQLIKAHSLYALADYSMAELAYQDALILLTPKDPRRPAIIENLAASVYRQAEAHLAADQKDLAIKQLLRVGQVAPTSTLRQNAEYDAANYLIELKRWPEAITVLTSFRADYPQHTLINTLPAKLALAYRETAQWSLAAGELKRMLALAETEQEKQDIAFIVAELYDKAEDKQEAILSYRAYANQYPDPADVYMEAANRLAELYQETGDPLKQRFWLAKQMQRVDELGDKADDRMRYLAARASSILANDAFIQYQAIRLSLPLDKSLVKKTEALEKALKAYQKTASYGISEFSTEAGFRMAALYTSLSKALMESDRPDDLNELELEQYEILLEEQVFPFEDSAIDIHEQNASRAWSGIYDQWVKKSFNELRRLLPGRYAKDEVPMGGIHVLQ